MKTTNISLRIDSGLKESAQSVLNDMNIKLSDVIRDTLEYIRDNKKLPVNKRVLSTDDEELLTLARERLARPGQIYRNVTGESLLDGHPGRSPR